MPTTKSRLTFEDKRKLYFLLNEMKERGLDIPDEAKSLFRKEELVWPVDANGYFIRKDGHHFVPYEEQRKFIVAKQRYSLFRGGRGSGKALAIDTPILTPSGWKNMDDIHVGESVLGSDGYFHVVIDESPIMYNHNCYKVWFDDSQYIVADEEHLWITETKLDRKYMFRGKRILPKTKTTLELSTTLTHLNERNHSIPLPSPINVNKNYETLPPYFLGFWLGDGKTSGSSVTIGNEDKDEVLFYFNQSGITCTSSNKLSYQLNFSCVESSVIRNSTTGRFERNDDSLYAQLDKIGLLNNKHIPYQVLLSDFDYRLDVLRGLMDSDGYIDRNGKCEFCTTSDSLANGFLSLCYSLGIKVSKRKGTVKFRGRDFIRYRFTFIPNTQIFKLERKANRIDFSEKSQKTRRQRRFITNIEKTESVPVKCITVDSPNHLYLAGYNLIPTHNSGSGAQKALKKIQQGFSGAVINPVFSDFIDSTWQEFKQWIPWDMVVVGHRYRARDDWQPNKPFRISFMNGAFVICKGLKNPESARGPNINWAWYDEGRNDPTGLAWKNLISSVRVGDNPQAWCTTTPVGISHWMYDFFEEQNVGDDVKELLEKLGLSVDDLTSSFHGSIEDNKDNLDPMFYASIMSSYPSGYLRDREVFGEYSDAGGKIGDARWFDGKKVTEVLPDQISILRYWDLAATEKKQASDDPDEMVGTLLSKHKNQEISEEGKRGKPLFLIQNQVCGRWGADKTMEIIADVARSDGPFVKVVVEQEPAASGKITVAAVKEYFKRFPELSAHTVEGLDVKKVGDRVLAANLLWFSVASEGRMYMIEGIWNKEMLKQLDGFGNPKLHDDRITSITNGMYLLNPYRTWKKIDFVTT